MLLFLLSLIGYAEEPTLSIIVSDNRYEEIYMEEPKVTCESSCIFDHDTSLIFVEANRNHRAWFKAGKISGIYNHETIRYAHGDCDFKKDSLGCAAEAGIWVMRTTITQNSDRASINLILFDDTAAAVGQSTFTRLKKQTVVRRKRVTQQRVPSPPMSITNCNKDDKGVGSCASIPFQSQGQNTSQVEDLEPIIISAPPILSARDVNQAMIMLYDSVR